MTITITTTKQRGAMSVIEIAVPDIGDFDEVEVIEVLVKPGDDIAVEQSLITVESDKASMEIPSAAAGKLHELKVKIGDKISKGTVIATLEEGQAAAPAASDSDVAAAPAASVAVGSPAPKSSPSPASSSSPAAKSSSPRAAATPSPTTAALSPSPTQGETGSSERALIEVQVPDIGDFDEVEVIEVLVAVGDSVAVEASLITVESDKASMEIPSSAAGKVTRILVKVGDKVAKGTPVVVVEGGSGSAPAPAAQQPEPAASPAPAKVSTAAAPSASPAEAAPPPGSVARSHPVPADMRDGTLVAKPHASPSVRLFARELGVDLSLVQGTGPKERITAEDVKGFVKGAVAQAGGVARGAAATGADSGAALGLIPWPKVDFARFGEIEVKPQPRIRKISAANLHRNWVMIPHVTNHDDCDITELEAFRVTLNAENAKSGAKLTMLAFLVKACVAALKKFPEFNSSLDGESLVYKRYYHIGVAADTPNGLMVPVIKDADTKGLFQIAAEMSELAQKARDGKLSPGDMQGGTFSISSLGGIGGTYFTPIINAPEVSILGVCRASKQAVWNEAKGVFEPRLILPLSLSWDHRVIDGAAAARFNSFLGQLLGDFRRIVL